LNKGKVLIAGGSGFIGKHLYMALYKAGYNVYILSRNKKLCTREDFIYWNPDKGEINLETSMSFDGIINLCGEGIASKKWTSARKKELIQSRTTPAGFLSQLIHSGQVEYCCIYWRFRHRHIRPPPRQDDLYGNRRNSICFLFIELLPTVGSSAFRRLFDHTQGDYTNRLSIGDHPAAYLNNISLYFPFVLHLILVEATR
jgi:hypothetical protein